MSPEAKAPIPESLRAGHEVRDANVRGIALVAVALILGAVIMHLGLGRFLHYLKKGRAPVAHVLPQPPAPRLQKDPAADWVAYSTREMRWLKSYGWIDAKRQSAHVPIDRAIELYLAQHSGRGPSSLETSRATTSQEVAFHQRIGETLPLDVAFRDEDGRERNLGSFLAGKPAIVVFSYFHCPNLCSLVLDGLARALREEGLQPGREVTLLSVSIDPLDPPRAARERQRSALARVGLPLAGHEAGWRFLTGEERSIRRVATAAGFVYRYDAPSKQYEHASGFLVTDARGRITHDFFGVRFAGAEVREALRQASAGQTGSPIEEILISCFHYDPRHNAAGIWVERGLAAASGATLLVLALILRPRRAVPRP